MAISDPTTIPFSSPEDQESARRAMATEPAERAAYADMRRMSAQTLMDFPDWLRQNYLWMERVPLVPSNVMQQAQQQYEQYRGTQLAMSELDLRDQAQQQRRAELEHNQAALAQRQKEHRQDRRDKKNAPPTSFEAAALANLDDPGALEKISAARAGLYGPKTATAGSSPVNSIEALLARTAAAGGDTAPILELARQFAGSSGGGGGGSPVNTMEAGAARSLAMGDKAGARAFMRGKKRLAGGGEGPEGLLDPKNSGGDKAIRQINDQFLAGLKKLREPTSNTGFMGMGDTVGPTQAALELAELIDENGGVMGKRWTKIAEGIVRQKRPTPDQITAAIRSGEISRDEAARLLELLYSAEERAALKAQAEQQAPIGG